jgi:L-arabinokinase
MDPAAEIETFVETLRADRLFEPGALVAVSRAPGRLDVMGGIADYSGSLVLQRTIAEATFAAVQKLDRPVIEVVSIGRTPCTIPLETLAREGVPISYDAARRFFAGDRESGRVATPPHWASYIAGGMLVLSRERGVPLTSGARIVVASRVPEGKGVSSSAAVEVSTMHGVAGAFGIALGARDLALLCQQTENLVAGAPCGVMDQMTSVCGAADSLLALLCQPAELQPSVLMPERLALWGLDSGERHAVGGSDYGAVRAAAFMGLRMLSERVRVPGNYLANLSPEEFETELANDLPGEIAGEAFLERFGGTTDTVTTAERGRQYRVRAATAHPIYERRRAERFRRLLRESLDQQELVELGTLMYESHCSYGACGLGSPGTDRLVELVRAEGPDAGLFGARITGGGSGGTVAVIGRPDASAAIHRVVDAYESATGYRPYVFAGSSPGAMAFGAQLIQL